MAGKLIERKGFKSLVYTLCACVSAVVLEGIFVSEKHLKDKSLRPIGLFILASLLITSIVIEFYRKVRKAWKVPVNKSFMVYREIYMMTEHVDVMSISVDWMLNRVEEIIEHDEEMEEALLSIIKPWGLTLLSFALFHLVLACIGGFFRLYPPCQVKSKPLNHMETELSTTRDRSKRQEIPQHQLPDSIKQPEYELVESKRACSDLIKEREGLRKLNITQNQAIKDLRQEIKSLEKKCDAAIIENAQFTERIKSLQQKNEEVLESNRQLKQESGQHLEQNGELMREKLQLEKEIVEKLRLLHEELETFKTNKVLIDRNVNHIQSVADERANQLQQRNAETVRQASRQLEAMSTRYILTVCYLEFIQAATIERAEDSERENQRLLERNRRLQRENEQVEEENVKMANHLFEALQRMMTHHIITIFDMEFLNATATERGIDI